MRANGRLRPSAAVDVYSRRAKLNKLLPETMLDKPKKFLTRMECHLFIDRASIYLGVIVRSMLDALHLLSPTAALKCEFYLAPSC
jgi:hypothetical protein